MRVAIQGELGSNSHMAALEMLGDVEIVPCAVSPEVFERLVDGSVSTAVLPIENSLHGSVAEHYDLLLDNPVAITGESLLRIRFNLIAMPGVELAQISKVISHPVALAQCRRFLAAHREMEALPFYDTAGAVKHLIAAGLRDVAGIAPELAAREYGGAILLSGLEDHPANFTRFLRLERADNLADSHSTGAEPELRAEVNKMTIAFTVKHWPGTLVAALSLLSEAGVDLTKIESRPVVGSPWEYVFYVEVRFDHVEQPEKALERLRRHCGMVKELGRYRSA